MSNQVNSTKVVTGKVRFCYVNVFEPTAMNEGDTPKYNICVLIPKSDTATIDKIKKAVEAAKEAGKAKLADKNGRIPANLKLPLRDGDEERPDDPAFEDHYFINANSMRQPSIVDRSLNPIMSRDEFYSGCYGRASINFYAFNVYKKISCHYISLMYYNRSIGGTRTRITGNKSMLLCGFTIKLLYSLMQRGNYIISSS